MTARRPSRELVRGAASGGESKTIPLSLMQAYGSKSRKPCFRAAQFLYPFGAIGASALATSLRGQTDAVLADSLLAVSALGYLLHIICTPNR